HYRKTIIHTLSRFHHPAAYQALTEAIVTENGDVDADALQSLLDLYHSPEPSELKKEEQSMMREELHRHMNDHRIRALLREYNRASLPMRKQLIEILGLAQSVDAVWLFLQELQNPELQEQAVQALFDCDQEASSLLLQRLQEEGVEEEEQGLDLAILGHMTVVPQVPNHQKWLGHENPEIRLQAFRLLTRAPMTGVDQWLMGGAIDPYTPIQDFCREPLLERCRSSKTLRQEVSERMRERAHSEDPAERAAALEILIRLEGESSFPLLFEALKDEDAAVRQKAIGLMSSGYHHEFQKFLIAALADEDARVREQAARALSAYDGTEVSDALVSSMHDEALWVRIATGESLATIGDDSVVPAFLHQVETETPIGRAVLLRCLGQFRHPQTKDTLLRYLNSDDPEIRKSACESLSYFSDSDIVFRLFTLMQNDPDWGVRVAAVRALAAIRPFRLQEALLERLRADTDPFVRKEILTSLQKLGIDYPPQEVYEFLLDRHLADAAYEFLMNGRQKFAKQIQEASAKQPPAVRRILKTIVS
ncbi:MAG TPA: HEAT repeat domain-containing protein, partial [Acidobacteriota bacterium]|nr:HEAT repeat domain-containing protein [Acidobacteriota bacterium]